MNTWGHIRFADKLYSEAARQGIGPESKRARAKVVCETETSCHLLVSVSSRCYWKGAQTVSASGNLFILEEVDSFIVSFTGTHNILLAFAESS